MMPFKKVLDLLTNVYGNLYIYCTVNFISMSVIVSRNAINLNSITILLMMVMIIMILMKKAIRTDYKLIMPHVSLKEHVATCSARLECKTKLSTKFGKTIVKKMLTNLR